MRLFLQMAFRNLKRNKRLSLITGLMIFIGTFMMILLLTYGHSLSSNLTDVTINTLTGNIQIHNTNIEEMDLFNNDWEIIDSTDEIIKKALKIDGVEEITPRLEVYGMLSTGEDSINIALRGVDFKAEPIVSPKLQVTQGEWLEGENGILLTDWLMKELKVNLGDELVFLTKTPDGILNGVALKLSGVIDAGGLDMFIYNTAYADISSVRELLYLENDQAHTLVVSLKKGVAEEEVITRVNSQLSEEGYELNASSWEEMGGMYYGIVVMNRIWPKTASAFLLFIVVVGIFNTVVMSVLERKKEIGILLALGTKHLKVLKVFVLEMGILSVFASGIGVLASLGVIYLLSIFGIPAVGEIMEVMFGGSALYFSFAWFETIFSFFIVIVTSVLAAYIPAWKIRKFNPMEILRESE